MRFFGIDLDDLRSGRRSVRAVSNAAAHVPRGGAVGEWYGGQLAITPETESLWELTHTLAQVHSKKRVKPRPMPDGVREQKRKADRAAIMAAKYRRKRG